MKKRKRLRALWLIPLVLAGGAAGWYFLKGRKVQTTSLVVQQRTAVAERGVLNITLSGSGSVRPADTAEVRISSDATVEKSFLEERKYVRAGEVLLTLEGEDTGINEKKLRNTLEQKQLAYRKLIDQLEAFNITTPIGGEVTEILVEVGNEIKSGTALMTITDTSVLTAEVSFENTPMETIETDQVVLHLPDYMTTVPAIIRSQQQNGSNTDVTVIVENSGLLKPGIVVRCEITGAEGAVVSTAGTLQWNRVETISAKTSGMLQSLSVSKGDTVTEGAVIAVLYDDEAEVNLENARLQVEEAQLNLNQLLEKSVRTEITAPINGYLTSIQKLAPGDTVKSGTVIATIINMDEMEFSINIDELDINKVSEGQDVYVTVEAIEETQDDPIMGKVTGIALQGNTSNGVTSYPVTIRVPGREGLKAGMNVDAVNFTFLASSPENVDAAMEAIKAFLTEAYGSENLFRVSNATQILNTLDSVTGTLMTVLGGIAAISLLVGGIGIMNIMLVSVTERTREIGIRKAIGAKRRNILTQFLIEALLVTGMGGIIGLLTGSAAIWAIGRAGLVPAVYSPLWMTVSFGISLAVGLIFGIFPAAKASRLNPITALRHE